MEELPQLITRIIIIIDFILAKLAIISVFSLKTETMKDGMIISAEGLSFFFVGGAAVGVILARDTTHFYLISAVSFAASWLLLAALLSIEGWDNRFPGNLWMVILPLLILSTGFFTGITGGGLSSPDSESYLELAAFSAANRLRSLIDGIPFPSEGTSPLLKALLTGDRSSLSKEVVTVFRSSGASHLLALSGLHIGIIYLIFKSTIRFMEFTLNLI